MTVGIKVDPTGASEQVGGVDQKNVQPGCRTTGQYPGFTAKQFGQRGNETHIAELVEDSGVAR